MARTEARVVGVWLISRTALTESYPWACRASKACPRSCPCRGRIDNVVALPTYCCARRSLETARRKAA